MNMHLLVIIGLLLVVLGIFPLCYQGFTYFTHEPVAQVGNVQINQERAHTVWLSPVLGITSLVVGGLLIVLGRRERPGEL